MAISHHSTPCKTKLDASTFFACFTWFGAFNKCRSNLRTRTTTLILALSITLGGYGGRRLGARVLGGGVVYLEGQPCPSLYRWRGRARGGDSLPNSVSQVGRRWRGGTPPQVGFLLPLHLTK